MAQQPIDTASTQLAVDFAKGHGTENDFVLIPDPDGRLTLTEADVRLLCDRHAGIGGDGVIRVVRRSAETDEQTGVPDVQDAEWFMDYRNADGSVAQMCGNGVRVFARYLQRLGFVDSADLPVITRSGVKLVSFGVDGRITVDMGPAEDLGTSAATVRAFDSKAEYAGRAVSMGNPHLACDLSGEPAAVAGLDLSRAPSYDASFFPEGVNLEFFEQVPGASETDAHVRMRVYERGVGETRSCGTGICAVAYATLANAGKTEGTVIVDVPGGRLLTAVSPATVLLTGPAEIVAEGSTVLLRGR
ncbi:diaminopimelate epimerase [Antricoccus suffuscus]|uniref:Diaminopimelate epimerase n=1 Tax=Antricoccus suffuscus TaxID=1629062 RepID=A0A2T1A4V6_9ACTN|nr:diaminopimelate epimerase [Antricoccus suffuscus]PRZ43630.1 diaminopimelate epimerase [Antricoccus suffuscus]